MTPTTREEWRDLRVNDVAVAIPADENLPKDLRKSANDLVSMRMRREELRDDSLQLDLLSARAAVALGDRDKAERTLRSAESQIAALGLPRAAPARLAAATVGLQLADRDGRDDAANEMALLQRNDTASLNGTLEFATLLRVCETGTVS